MFYLTAKALLSGVIIMAVSEIAKRSPAFGALGASLPLVSLLAILWLWPAIPPVSQTMPRRPSGMSCRPCPCSWPSRPYCVTGWVFGRHWRPPVSYHRSIWPDAIGGGSVWGPALAAGASSEPRNAFNDTRARLCGTVHVSFTHRSSSAFARAEWEENAEPVGGRVVKGGEVSLGIVRDFRLDDHWKVGLGGLYAFEMTPGHAGYGNAPHGGMAFARLIVE
jgi:hypothetical protein